MSDEADAAERRETGPARSGFQKVSTIDFRFLGHGRSLDRFARIVPS
jgi:hypothetical protein